MLETIHCLFKFIIAFECIFKCLNRRFICLFSRRCREEIRFSFVILLRCICLNWMIFFSRRNILLLHSLQLRMSDYEVPRYIDFLTPLCRFRRSLSFGLPPLRLPKALPFRSFSCFLFRFRPCIAGRDVLYVPIVAAPYTAIASTFSLAKPRCAIGFSRLALRMSRRLD